MADSFKFIRPIDLSGIADGLADTRFVISGFEGFFNENGIYVGEPMYVYPGLKIYDPTIFTYYGFLGQLATNSFSLNQFHKEVLGAERQAYQFGGLIYQEATNGHLAITAATISSGTMYQAGDNISLSAAQSSTGVATAIPTGLLLIATSSATALVPAKFAVFNIDLSGKLDRILDDSANDDTTKTKYIVYAVDGKIYKSEIDINNVGHVLTDVVDNTLNTEDDTEAYNAAKDKAASGVHTHKFGSSTFETVPFGAMPDAHVIDRIIHNNDLTDYSEDYFQDITKQGDRRTVIAEAPILLILQGDAPQTSGDAYETWLNSNYSQVVQYLNKANFYLELNVNDIGVQLLTVGGDSVYEFDTDDYKGISYIYIVDGNGIKQKVDVTLTTSGAVNYWTGVWLYNNEKWLVQIQENGALLMCKMSSVPNREVDISSFGPLPDGMIFVYVLNENLYKAVTYNNNLFITEYLQG